ncbi:hypothetical protein KY345_02345 [Candidatus Woesearchaeota archaeon]|nr:hypothetical protein [Candidatus Woesearchaeota archaeon]
MKRRNKMKPRFSWQGVGISSNPDIKRDPISLHMLAYLRYGSESAEQHKVVIGDSMQAVNYELLHGLNPKKAYRLALKKGKRKQRDLEKICRAYDLNNVSFVRFDELRRDIEPIREKILDVYRSDKEIRDGILDTIPDRMKRMLSEGDIDRLAEYTINELAFTLHLGGMRVSHAKQKKIDRVAERINEKYGIGNNVEYDYPGFGLDFDTKTKYRFEPYSGVDKEGRILLTDSVSQLEEKAEMSEKRAKEVNKILRKTWGMSLDNVSEFYDKIIEKGNFELDRFRQFTYNARIAGCSAFALATTIVFFWALGSAIHEDLTCSDIRERMDKSPPNIIWAYYWGRLNDCERSRQGLIKAVKKSEFGPYENNSWIGEAARELNKRK